MLKVDEISKTAADDKVKMVAMTTKTTETVTTDEDSLVEKAIEAKDKVKSAGAKLADNLAEHKKLLRVLAVVSAVGLVYVIAKK